MNYYRFGELKEVLSIYEQGKNHVESCLNKISINQDLLKLHDELYEKHIENCEKYVQQYSQQNNIQIFQYCIGRLNLVKKDVEVARCGFSKFYLDFIGLDLDIFNQMLMRQQKIDLIQDKDELFNIFSEGIKKNFLENLNKFDKNFYIKTFDGFSIKIKFRKHDFKPDFKCPSLFLEYLYKFEFIFHITEVDIDLQDLQNLILYRERLSNSQNNLSYDDFIKKELSYLFEDVEYSVHSQAFAEKFYQKNIQKLKIIQKKQVIGKLLQQNKKYCGYKVVNNPSEIKPIQII